MIIRIAWPEHQHIASSQLIDVMFTLYSLRHAPVESMKLCLQCSQTCGFGVQQRRVICTEVTSNRAVEDKSCSSNDRPETQRECSLSPCPAMWITSDWTRVSMHSSPCRYTIIILEYRPAYSEIWCTKWHKIHCEIVIIRDCSLARWIVYWNAY